MGSCQHVDCAYQGPRTAPRRVVGGETELHYCGHHDPLKPDTSADSELWEAVPCEGQQTSDVSEGNDPREAVGQNGPRGNDE